MPKTAMFPRSWAGITGDWVLGERSARYVGSGNPYPHGILIGSDRIGGVKFSRVTVKSSITLSQDAESGHILLGYDSQDLRYVTVGLDSR